MHVFDTVHAEPRDYIGAPTYRVNFWQRRTPRTAWNLDAHILTGVDGVLAVLRWAEANAGGRRFEIFVEIDEEPAGPFDTPRTTGLVRLLGTNPNEGEPEHVAQFIGP